MNFSTYQHDARRTAVYPRPLETQEGSFHPVAFNSMQIIPVMYCALGLAGEAGEVTEQVKKSWRNNMEITKDRKEKIADELGDVLWYVSNLATELGLNLESIAGANLTKLAKREQEGNLKKQ